MGAKVTPLLVGGVTASLMVCLDSCYNGRDLLFYRLLASKAQVRGWVCKDELLGFVNGQDVAVVELLTNCAINNGETATRNVFEGDHCSCPFG